MAAVGGFFAPAGAVRFYRQRRVKLFNTQLTEALQQMSNALRAASGGKSRLITGIVA